MKDNHNHHNHHFEHEHCSCCYNDEKNNEKNIDEKHSEVQAEPIEKPNREAEYLELAQRLKAEFDNYKKRNAEVASVSYANGIVALTTKLLPALDSFQQAKSNIKDETVLSGIDLIYDQIMKALNDVGVEKINCLGNLFDPNFHNAVLTEHNEDYPDQTVLEEYQAGFVLKDKLIRPSVVKINKLS